eukprot:Gb_09910 [translate_table: standard]
MNGEHNFNKRSIENNKRLTYAVNIALPFYFFNCTSHSQVSLASSSSTQELRLCPPLFKHRPLFLSLAFACLSCLRLVQPTPDSLCLERRTALKTPPSKQSSASLSQCGRVPWLSNMEPEYA